jgi:hypothetical protein
MENFYKTPDGNFISFEWRTDKNNFLSEKEQKPVFDKVLMGHVRCPGQQKSEAVIEFIRESVNGNAKRNVSAFDKYKVCVDEFMRHGDGGQLQGTPVDHWKDIDMKTAATLKAMNVFTVEALATLSDAGLQNLGMGARSLQAQAKTYLEASKSKDDAVALAQKVAAENQILKEANEELNSKLTALSEKLDALIADEDDEDAETKPRTRKKRSA